MLPSQIHDRLEEIFRVFLPLRSNASLAMIVARMETLSLMKKKPLPSDVSTVCSCKA